MADVLPENQALLSLPYKLTTGLEECPKQYGETEHWQAIPAPNPNWPIRLNKATPSLHKLPVNPPHSPGGSLHGPPL